MAANNEIGTIEPIAEIAAIAREAGVYSSTPTPFRRSDTFPWTYPPETAICSRSPAINSTAPGAWARCMSAGLRLPPLIHGGGQEKGRRSGHGKCGRRRGPSRCAERGGGRAGGLPVRPARRDRLIEGLTRLPLLPPHRRSGVPPARHRVLCL